MKRLAVLGSTGSIGRNTLQVVRECGDNLKVAALAAGSNVEELLRQTLEFRPDLVSLADAATRDRFWGHFRSQSLDGYEPEVLCGREGNLAAVTSSDMDVLVSAAVGVTGLEATFEAVRRGKRVALANKEVLVAAGQLVMAEAERSGAELLPVDSEHSGVHQCLRAGRSEEVAKLILTASGGPFRHTPVEELEKVTPAQALDHPTWRMGRRISIDSATLMNKGFEVIEACHLFGFSPSQVDVVVHPQSIVHAMVEFTDGSVVAQLSPPDMKLPIRYALSYPLREAAAPGRGLGWDCVRQLDFEPPDLAKFPMLGLAYRALEMGASAGCVLNAADEVAVQAFLEGRVPFSAIPKVVESTIETATPGHLASVAAVLEADREARSVARELIKEHAAALGA